jgi:hypothetical protein
VMAASATSPYSQISVARSPCCRKRGQHIPYSNQRTTSSLNPGGTVRVRVRVDTVDTVDGV